MLLINKKQFQSGLSFFPLLFEYFQEKTEQGKLTCAVCMPPTLIRFMAGWWPPHHVRMQVKQFSHPEDGGFTLLRNIGTTSHCRNPMDGHSLKVLG
jgi:hypothetical protein